ncbi:MAG: hypothetical protein JSS32_04140 [Verrucomicrobia bacterium]|nr:hypothetical protein [Verrucomicrobiota bacterium]
MAHAFPPQTKRILIITSSGGGGLLQAANAKEQEIKGKYPHVEIVRKDVLKDWVGKWLGAFSIVMWNSSQRKGNVAAQNFFGVFMKFSDYLFAPQVFYYSLKTFLKGEIDHVIDTQPLCTGTIIKALRIYNWIKKKRVVLEKILVDFPTAKAIHFFGPIRNLSSQDRKLIQVTTIPPCLDPGETYRDFWQKNCRISEAQVAYEPFFVRQSFSKYHKKPRSQDQIKIKAKIKNSEELQLIRKSVERGSIRADFSDKEVEFAIEPQDRVFTILLGSQPAYEGSLNYVRKFLQLGRECDSVTTHLFILCSNHRPKERSLLRSVSELVSQAKDYPKNFSVIPLSFQNDDVIAPLFYRSNGTCTRSGGQTLMELMCVSQGEIWIHSEAKKKGRLTDKELLNGIPGWESANAVYMQKMYGAKIVTPELFASHAKKILV